MDKDFYRRNDTTRRIQLPTRGICSNNVANCGISGNFSMSNCCVFKSCVMLSGPSRRFKHKGGVWRRSMRLDGQLRCSPLQQWHRPSPMRLLKQPASNNVFKRDQQAVVEQQNVVYKRSRGPKILEATPVPNYAPSTRPIRFLYVLRYAISGGLHLLKHLLG